jgi:hypoxanthine phosphoribosyltransferase
MDPQWPDVLISEGDIQRRVSELATQISLDYAGVDDLIMVGVLRGAFIFLADLSRRVTVRRRVDFIAVSTYGNLVETRGAVRLVMDLRVNVVGRHVLVVEDIVDTGYTLRYLMGLLTARSGWRCKSTTWDSTSRASGRWGTVWITRTSSGRCPI